MKTPPTKQVLEFLRESNNIEDVWDDDSLVQAWYAWDYVMGEKLMTPSVVLKTHKILMLHQNLLPNEKGYFREVPVYIGGRQAIHHSHILKELQSWCNNTNNVITETQEAWAQSLHLTYEWIHPFVDGNGRTGRIFLNWHRLRMGLPILNILEQEKDDYYKWFDVLS